MSKFKVKTKFVFDIADMTDIPQSVKKNIVEARGMRRKGFLSPKVRRILGLFLQKGDLSINQVVVAMYRLFAEQPTRGWVHSVLDNLMKRDVLERCYDECSETRPIFYKLTDSRETSKLIKLNFPDYSPEDCEGDED